MTHFVYILYSKSTNKFYTEETPDVLDRLKIHNSPQLNTNSTKGGLPWEIFHQIQVSNRVIAMKIEGHIKKMKSKIYIENLKKYPKIIDNLVKLYS